MLRVRKYAKIQRFQTRAARIIIGNWNWEMSGLLLVKILRWLSVTQRQMYIWQCPPNYLNDLLIQVSHVQQRFTRANNDFYVPRANIEL